MRKTFLTLVALVFAIAFSNDALAQDFKDLDKSPMDVASYPSSFRESDKVIKITYSRPQLKGRKLTKLAPFGKVWRTGANEATEITFYKDVTFAGKPVKAGTYTLYTIPGAKEWTVIISKQLNVWGSYFYKKDQDVARVTAPVKKSNKNIEAFSIAIDDGMDIHMGWGDVVVSVPVE